MSRSPSSTLPPPPEVELKDILRSVWPFMGLQLVGLAIIMACPQIALWLPSLMR
jgi:TRAP-type C4-dicarboxylate transport system permease large subunit